MARLRGVLACLVACFSWGGVSIQASANHIQPGFAIWPEDNEAAATAACQNRGEDEAWRTNREETAMRFVSEELGWPEPVMYTDPETESPSTAVVGDETPRRVFLGVVETLVKHGDCWYVVDVIPRESGGSTTVGFVEIDGETNLYLRSGGFGPDFFIDYGFGDENDVRGVEGERMLIPVEDETTTGHYFAYEEDQPSEYVDGRTLPVPMDPSDAEPATPLGGYAMWPFHEVGRYSGVSRCRRDWMQEPDKVVKAFVRENVGEIDGLERQDRAHWIVSVDNARFRVVLRHVRNDCWPVRRVKSLDRVIGTTIRPLEGGDTIDFRWGDARTAAITLNYGGTWDGVFLERLPGPYSEPENYDFSRRGAFWIVLSDADGNVVGVEGSRLGPISDR
jgi:hypothetical protein